MRKEPYFQARVRVEIKEALLKRKEEEGRIMPLNMFIEEILKNYADGKLIRRPTVIHSESERHGFPGEGHTREIEVNDDTVIQPSPPLDVLHGKRKGTGQQSPEGRRGGKA